MLVSVIIVHGREMCTFWLKCVPNVYSNIRKVRIAYLMSTLRTFLVALQMLPPTHPPSHRAGILRRFVGLISIKNNYAGLSEAEKSIPQSLQTVSTKLDPTRGGGLISYFNFVQLDLTWTLKLVSTTTPPHHHTTPPPYPTITTTNFLTASRQTRRQIFCM